MSVLTKNNEYINVGHTSGQPGQTEQRSTTVSFCLHHLMLYPLYTVLHPLHLSLCTSLKYLVAMKITLLSLFCQ